MQCTARLLFVCELFIYHFIPVCLGDLLVDLNVNVFLWIFVYFFFVHLQQPPSFFPFFRFCVSFLFIGGANYEALDNASAAHLFSYRADFFIASYRALVGRKQCASMSS